MKRLIFVVGTMVAVLVSANAFADSSKSAGTICAHLEKHAEDYDADDAKKCPQELATILKEMPADAVVSFEKCVVAHQPLTKEQFGECLAPLLAATAPVEKTAEAGGTPSELGVKLCAHMKANAQGMKDDFATCEADLVEMEALMGQEGLAEFAECVLAVPKPTEEDLGNCLMPIMEKTLGAPPE